MTLTNIVAAIKNKFAEQIPNILYKNKAINQKKTDLEQNIVSARGLLASINSRSLPNVEPRRGDMVARLESLVLC